MSARSRCPFSGARDGAGAKGFRHLSGRNPYAILGARMARSQSDDARSDRIELRASTGEKALLLRAATLERLDLTISSCGRPAEGGARVAAAENVELTDTRQPAGARSARESAGAFRASCRRRAGAPQAG